MVSVILASVAALLHGASVLVSYVTNSDAFPHPLSTDRESELLGQIKTGNEEARTLLVEHNLRLVAHIVKKFDNSGEDTDDLISIGTIGLIKAIRTFKPERQTRLATYAARCIENEILMHLRSLRKSRNDVLLFDPIGSDKEGNEISLMDILGTDPNEVTERVEFEVDRVALYRKLQGLNRRERRVLELRYGLQDGIRKTQREISRLMGISRSYVSRIEKRALGKLQQYLAIGN